MLDFVVLAQQCAPQVETAVMSAIVDRESGFNPYAIGVVNGSIKQPTNYVDAVKAVRLLRSQGKNFSVGLSQVNKINFSTYNMTERNMFDPCTNLRAGSSIFANCLKRADSKYGSSSYDGKLRLAMSCYYSGNFKTGFKADFKGQPPYVAKVYSKIAGYRNSIQNTVRPQAIPLPLPNSSNDLAAYAQNAQNVKRVNNVQNNNEQKELVTRLTAAKVIGEANQALADVQVKNVKESVFNGDVFAAPTTDLFSARNQS